MSLRFITGKTSYLFIFATGVAVGLLPFHSFFWGGDWGALFSFVKDRTVIEFFLGDPLLGYYYLPAYLVYVKAMFGAFGLNPAPYHLVNALLLAAFGVLVLAFHRYMCPEKKTIAFLSALLFILSPYAVYMVWHSLRPEIMVGPLFYATMLLFVFLSRAGSTEGSKPRFALILFVSLFALGTFIRETYVGFATPLLLTYGFLAYRKKKLNGYLVLAITIAMLTMALRMLLHLRHVSTAQYPYDAALAVAYLAFDQLMTLVFFSGALVLLVAALSRFTDKEGLVGLPLLVIMFASPVILFINFEEELFYSLEAVPITSLFSFVLVAALILKLKRGDETGSPSSLYSLFILVAVAVKYLAPFVITSVRADTATRHYILFFPLLSWLVMDSLSSLWKRRRAAETGALASKINRTALSAIILSGLVLFPSHVVAASYDVGQLMDAVADVEYQGRKHLATLPQDNVIIQMGYLTVMRPGEPALLSGLPHKDATIGVTEDVQRLGLTPLDQVSYYYFVNSKPVSNAWCEKLVGTYGLFYGGPAGGYAELQYGCKPTQLETYLARNATKLFETKRRYMQVPRALEDFPARIANGIPFAMEYESTVAVYRVYDRIG